MNRPYSGKISFCEVGADEIVKRLSGDTSSEADMIRKRAEEIKYIAKSWTPDTPTEERSKIIDELFVLFRRVMTRNN